MAVTVSLVLLFGALLGFLLKMKAIGVGVCFVAVMFGFLLASTGAAGPINRGITGAAHSIGQWNP
ncbi:hypothetical protein G3I60_36425 [Streptomyces sp. SID13666]|uniref:hypothetical protein n=1 Tax=Streptomyces sp. SID13666 TaxID=2706054 RepID=UPI0013C275A8|nr:hypothetical protein [Streptomyces sp. SID13666]NEA59504.1 hypothetical protein [Streptomyces sp. SID13666]